MTQAGMRAPERHRTGRRRTASRASIAATWWRISRRVASSCPRSTPPGSGAMRPAATAGARPRCCATSPPWDSPWCGRERRSIEPSEEARALMARKRPGPRAQAGPRYPCGRRKSVGDVRAPTLWRRIKDNGIALGLDRRLGSEVGRLSLLGELTDTEAATAFLIAEIYGRFERYSGKRRTAHSPSYDIGRGAEPTEDHDHERRARRARKQFDRLQACLPVYPPQARTELEQLCCED